MFAHRGFTPQPILTRTQGTGTNSQNNICKQPRLWGEVFQHRQRYLCRFPCRYELLQPQCNEQRLWPHVLPALALAWESKALWITKAPGMIQSQQWDHVGQDTGRADPLEKKVLLTPQKKQPKQQHIPENTARHPFRNVTSLLVFTGSFMSCFLHHHSFKTAMPTPFSPCTVYCYGFSVLCNPVSVRILLQFTLLLTSFNCTAHTTSQTASPTA